MERNEVSIHEVLVYQALASAKAWLTNEEITNRLEGKVARRTVRAHTMKLASLGMVEQADVFPAHKFKLSAKADKRNKGYWQRLRDAAEVFGIAVA